MAAGTHRVELSARFVVVGHDDDTEVFQRNVVVLVLAGVGEDPIDLFDFPATGLAAVKLHDVALSGGFAHPCGLLKKLCSGVFVYNDYDQVLSP